MMKIRGVNVWPAAFDAGVFGVPGVLDYRGTVSRGAEGGERVELRVECEPGVAETVPDAVEQAVRRHTGLSVEVTRVAPGSLSREVPEGFVKVRRWDDRRRGPRT
jgi:phenylacetate-coenzyme A ligase PaaK-like adenylate-forming protein